MEQMLPIGSVIKTNGKLYLVLGQRLIELNNQMLFAYVIVGYPAGYLGIDHVYILPKTEVEEILYIGQEDAHAKGFRERLELLYDAISKCTPTELAEKFSPEQIRAEVAHIKEETMKKQTKEVL